MCFFPLAVAGILDYDDSSFRGNMYERYGQVLWQFFMWRVHLNLISKTGSWLQNQHWNVTSSSWWFSVSFSRFCRKLSHLFCLHNKWNTHTNWIFSGNLLEFLWGYHVRIHKWISIRITNPHHFNRRCGHKQSHTPLLTNFSFHSIHCSMQQIQNKNDYT